MSHLQAVPCNIITGFLGVGKTSAILNLLKNKPSHERWAVLVNEFGEIGIDGSLFEGWTNTSTSTHINNSGNINKNTHTNSSNIFIREVPGGCMCCAAGLPMQIALNQLLARAKPDRLLIEPTGLGHPKEIIAALSAEHYSDVLDIQKIVTLVDARKLSDTRYTQHSTFNEQIAIADVIVGNKQDLYSTAEPAALMQYISEHASVETKVYFTEQAILQDHWLQGTTQLRHTKYNQHNSNVKHNNSPSHHKSTPKPDINQQAFPECGYLSASNQAEGFYSIGWRFAPSKIFHYAKIKAFLLAQLASAERIKATIISTQGGISFNLTKDTHEEASIDLPAQSRLEIITPALPANLEQQLIACLND
ncbi:CobW family GTP-binding protein [Marinagarivorans algicola]|uniref:CobW family GTP-binding protein n=1 Tax=Marinagarivorans algicola TaxID=1513270 RepID=UPI003734E4F2